VTFFSFLIVAVLFNSGFATGETTSFATTFQITITEDSDFGEINPSPADGSSYIEVDYNTDKEFSISAYSHYSYSDFEAHTHHISEVYVNDLALGLLGTGLTEYEYEFNNISSDSMIEAFFTGWVDIAINGSGAVSFSSEDGSTYEVTSSGSIEYDADIDQSFEIEPGAGYYITNVELDGVSVGAVSTYTFNEENPSDHTLEVTCSVSWYSITPSSTYNTIYNDSTKSSVATTQYPSYGEDQSFYVDLDDSDHGIEAILIDNVSVTLPDSGSTYIDPDGDYALINSDDETLEIEFTGVAASHRVVVIDYDETSISDIPLVASSISAPANIMFIVDDSGSMQYSTMVAGVNSGLFCIGGSGDSCTGGVRYSGVFDSSGWRMIPETSRKLWKSQWYEYNKMYYNPNVTYEPWPWVVEISQDLATEDSTDDDDMYSADVDARSDENADTESPRLHPLQADSVLILSDEFTSFEQEGADSAIIDDEDVGFSWSDSDHWSQYGDWGAYGNDYYYATNRTADKWATWEFTPEESGEYEITISWETVYHMSWGHVDYYNETVDYTVTCPSCTTSIDETISVDQTDDGSADNGDPSYSIGIFTLEAGKTVEVTLSDSNNSLASSTVDAVKFSQAGIVIPNAHYYLWSATEGAPYLVVFDSETSSILYYKASGNSLTSSLDLDYSNEEVDSLETVEDDAVPDDVKVSDDYDTALQNFANWVTYYRERRCAAVSAVSRSLVLMDSVNVGLSPLNDFDDYIVPLKAVNVDGEDYTADLLQNLYDWPASGNTPLRNALEEVGQYFADTDQNSWSEDYDSPYASEDDGGECQQTFTILMTDGYYNGSRSSTSEGFGTGTDESGYYNSDSDGTDGADPSDYTDSDGDTLYASSEQNTLADIAMYYYETDLNSSLDDDVSTSPDETETKDDPATWQHMVTYTVAFGLSGELDQDDYELNVTADTPNYPVWPEPESNSPSTIDDLWHAAINGRGLFLNADDPDELVESLATITENISKRTGSGASMAVNSDELYETIDSTTRVYQTTYNTSNWYGDLEAYQLVVGDDDDGNDSDDDGVYDTPDWSASDVMQNSSEARNIFTYNNDEESGASFNPANLTTTQLKSLIPYFAFSDRSQEEVVDYLGGDTSNEGSDSDNFRSRIEPLGDFVNSAATYENGVLYVGGNDGMLHAFDATDGSEKFAYIPGLVYQDLRELANPDYSHTYYVDNTVYIKEISDSLTLLVGGLNKGGKGYFALDITDPGNFTTSNVKWEYPSAPDVLVDGKTSITFNNSSSGNDTILDSDSGFTDTTFDAGNSIRIIGADCDGYSNNGTYEILSKNSDGELELDVDNLIDGCGDGESITITKSISDTGMGYSFSDPIIVESNDSSLSSGELAGYILIFGNGYQSEDGTSQLYIVDPADGSLIKKINTGFGPANGLSTATAIDVDYDLKVDYVYAGDLLGNMWKFDLSSDSYSDWQVAFCDDGDDTSHCLAAGAEPQPLFSAMNNQPITGAPDIMNHPEQDGYLVIFGTGKFLGEEDLESTYLQSLYGIWDWAPDNYDLGYLGQRGGALEDVDGDGVLDDAEDLDGNGLIDELSEVTLSNSPNVDSNGDPLNTLLRQEILSYYDDDGEIVVLEGEISEDTDGDGYLDEVDEDTNDNGTLDDGEDLDGDGNLDIDEDVDDDGEMDSYSYYRTITANDPDWSVDSTIDVNGDGAIDEEDEVPQSDLGWYFDLPGKIMDGDNLDNDYDGEVDESGERAVGERVSYDMLIRDEKIIIISYGVTGSVCDVGMYSFLNERDAETGGRYDEAIYDINGDGLVNDDDTVMIFVEGEEDQGYFSDVSIDGQAFSPVILEDDADDGTEVKIMSTSTGDIETVEEASETTGVYYWQQIE